MHIELTSNYTGVKILIVRKQAVHHIIDIQLTRHHIYLRGGGTCMGQLGAN